MSTPLPGYVRPPTDPLREFNEYFSKLYNQYGGQQGMLDRGFTPDKLREMQAPLRELQLNQSATDDQRRDALINALNTLHKQGMSINSTPDRSGSVGTAMPAPTSMGTPAQPMPPQGGLTLAATRPDPEFDINTATNTFFKSLGDRVASGQMTLDQARAAQAEMRALQLNPAMANRQAATEIAQRHLQVGPYSPNNMRQLTPAVMPPVTRLSPFQQAERTLGNAPAFPTTRMPTREERILADQQMMPMLKTPIREAPMPAPRMVAGPAAPTGIMGGIMGGAPAGSFDPSQLGQMLRGVMGQQPKSSFVDTMPKMNMPAPTGPQVMAPNAQAMALGGLMAKYRGGMC